MGFLRSAMRVILRREEKSQRRLLNAVDGPARASVVLSIVREWQRDPKYYYWNDVPAVGAVRSAKGDLGVAIARLRESAARALESSAKHVRDGGTPDLGTDVAKRLLLAAADLNNLRERLDTHQEHTQSQLAAAHETDGSLPDD